MLIKPNQVQGRGMKKPRCDIQITDTKLLRIRIDDDDRPEFWMEVVISRSDLIQVQKEKEGRK